VPVRRKRPVPRHMSRANAPCVDEETLRKEHATSKTTPSAGNEAQRRASCYGQVAQTHHHQGIGSPVAPPVPGILEARRPSKLCPNIWWGWLYGTRGRTRATPDAEATADAGLQMILSTKRFISPQLPGLLSYRTFALGPRGFDHDPVWTWSSIGMRGTCNVTRTGRP
jgi:hypothetical protein